MPQVTNREGMMIELPEFTEKLQEVEIPDDRFSKPKNKITKAQRAELRMKFGGRCAYCGCVLPEKGWHADHVEPVRRDFEMVRAPSGSRVTHVARSTGKVMHPELHAIENLFPACAPCNLFKGAFSVEFMRKESGKQIERSRAYSVNFRTAERFGLVELVDKPVVFWFEKYQKDCFSIKFNAYIQNMINLKVLEANLSQTTSRRIPTGDGRNPTPPKNSTRPSPPPSPPMQKG